MQTSLLTLLTNEPQESKKELLITEEKIITPLVQVLDQVTPTNGHKQGLESSHSFTQSLNDLFPEQAYEEKDIQKAKEVLGELANKLTAEQLRDVVAETKYLVESWLDDFEREIYNGLTLKELLHEKGGI